MDIVSSIVFISCPSLRTCSENLDLPSAYLKSFLCSLRIPNNVAMYNNNNNNNNNNYYYYYYYYYYTVQVQSSSCLAS